MNFPQGAKTATMARFALILILGFAVYSNVLGAPFLYDDSIYITGNPSIRSLKTALPFSGTRYVTLFSFALNYAFAGYNSAAYHAANVIIHIINSFLVYCLVLFTFKAPAVKPAVKDEDGGQAAFASALLFVAHPLATQGVSYVTQRFASLATLFYLLSLVLYAKARLREEAGLSAWRYFGASVLIAAVAQLTKEIAFTLPLTAVLYEFTFFKGALATRRFKRLAPLVLTLLIIPLIFLLSGSGGAATQYGIGEKVRALQMGEMAELSKYKYLLTEFGVIVKYLQLLILPLNQSAVYDINVRASILDPAVFLPLGLIVIILAAAVFIFVRSKKTGNAHGMVISFGVFWFFLTLSVESSVIPIKDTMFEHRAYLPSIGIITAGCAFVHLLANKNGKAFWAVVIALTAIASGLTYKRNFVWTDELVFWQDAVKKAPGRPGAHYNLGINYAERGMDDEAIREFNAAVRVAPLYDDAYFNLGVLYAKKGLYEEAIKSYSSAIALNPAKSADARLNLGLAYKAIGKKEEAQMEFQKAFEAGGGK